ncbi:MAG TPA: tetratricopeptide repeat protein [Xanthobacteraceae bacterium]|nr:tetratricopeptide repeat protein [Xanthobacteraceae bacterium]
MFAPCAKAAEQTPIESADRLFQSGEFAQAGEQYARIAADHPDDYSAILQLGRIALLSNRLGDAENWLKKAIGLRGGEADPKIMLAEVYYRRDDFEKAAASLDGIDVSTNPLIVSQYPTLNVAKLRSFKGQTPYQVLGDGQMTRLKFLRTDPLPLISVRVNGGAEVTFFIDTGGSEVALDTEFARELGVRNSAQCKARFPAASTLKFSKGGSNPSRWATGRCGIRPPRCYPCASFQKVLARSGST